MEKTYIQDRTFEAADLTITPLQPGEYEGCEFINCDLSNKDLSHFLFSECEFRDCNLSLAKLNKTSLRDVRFTNCKLLGLHFEACDTMLLSVAFTGCTLNHSSFFGLKMKKTVFKDTSLQEVDFTDADLSGSVFDNCDLLNTHFENTILEGADFRTAYNYSIDPKSNRIKNARFSITGITGLLDRFGIIIE
ncbi:MAG: hypothetical protein JWP69_456 [Flaviaesturariibacter sp.]|nr:hypothetical protein [Flaviaesturariibacter sp.]